MKEYQFWKIVLAFMLTQLVCIMLNISITKYLIEKHSVYRLYKNKVAELGTCYPWDSCEQTE